jgi:hypothetical protein
MTINIDLDLSTTNLAFLHYQNEQNRNSSPGYFELREQILAALAEDQNGAVNSITSQVIIVGGTLRADKDRISELEGKVRELEKQNKELAAFRKTVVDAVVPYIPKE